MIEGGSPDPGAQVLLPTAPLKMSGPKALILQRAGPGHGVPRSTTGIALRTRLSLYSILDTENPGEFTCKSPHQGGKKDRIGTKGGQRLALAALLASFLLRASAFALASTLAAFATG
jgi:hypothetical protein